MSKENLHIDILGGGIIGLACAYELVSRGAYVRVFDQSQSGSGASRVASGMLASGFETLSLGQTSPELTALCLASMQLWPEWMARLSNYSPDPSLGYDEGPSLLLMAQSIDQPIFDHILVSAGHALDLVEEISLKEASAYEPSLSQNIKRAALLKKDGQIDAQRVVTALHIAIESLGAEIVENTDPQQLDIEKGKVRGLKGLDAPDITLLCGGWQSLDILPQDILVRMGIARDSFMPVKGQILGVIPMRDGPRHVMRFGHNYIVPKADRILIGATMEPDKSDPVPSQTVLYAMRKRASYICPALANADILQMQAGIRPGTVDHLPLLRKLDGGDLYIATSHFRNGVLLAPITAQIMAEAILDGRDIDLMG